MIRQNTSKYGFQDAIASVANRAPIDVKKALEAASALEDDQELAHELIKITIDVDKTTVDALLKSVRQIKDEMWRARTLFSVFHQMRSSLVKELSEAAQDSVVALLGHISDEEAQVTALLNLSSDLPHALRARLAVLDEATADPLRRLQIALRYDAEDTDQRA